MSSCLLSFSLVGRVLPLMSFEFPLRDAAATVPFCCGSLTSSIIFFTISLNCAHAEGVSDQCGSSLVARNLETVSVPSKTCCSPWSDSIHSVYHDAHAVSGFERCWRAAGGGGALLVSLLKALSTIALTFSFVSLTILLWSHFLCVSLMTITCVRKDTIIPSDFSMYFSIFLMCLDVLLSSLFHLFIWQ